MMFGDFLIEKDVIKKEDLEAAIDLQKDNPDRRLGEILVTMGKIDKDHLRQCIELYILETNDIIDTPDQWLDQDEVDIIWNEWKKKMSQ